MVPRLPCLQPRIGGPISRPHPAQARLDNAVPNLGGTVLRSGAPGWVVTALGPITPRVRVHRGDRVVRIRDDPDITITQSIQKPGSCWFRSGSPIKQENL